MDSLPTVPSLPTTSVFDGLTTFIRDNAILMAVIFVILLISAYLNANFFKTLYHSMNNILYLSAKGTSDVVEPGLDQIQLLTKPEDYKRHLKSEENLAPDNAPVPQTEQIEVEYTPQQQAQPHVQEEQAQTPAVTEPSVEGFSLKPMSNKGSTLSKYAIDH